MPTMMFDFIAASDGADQVVNYIADVRKAVYVRVENLPTDLTIASHALIDSSIRCHANARPFIHAKSSWDLGEPQPSPAEAVEYLREAFIRLAHRLGRPEFAWQPQLYGAHNDARHRHAHGLLDRVDDQGYVFFTERIDEMLLEINEGLAKERGFKSPGWRLEIRPARIVNAETWNGRKSFTWWLQQQFRLARVDPKRATPAQIDLVIASKGVEREFVPGGMVFVYRGSRDYFAKASAIGIPSSLTRNHSAWGPAPPRIRTGDTYDRFLHLEESLTDYAREHPRRAEYERAIARGERPEALGKFLRSPQSRTSTTTEDPHHVTPPPTATTPASLRIASGDQQIEVRDRALLGSEFFPDLFTADDSVMNVHAHFTYDEQRNTWLIRPIGPTVLDDTALAPLEDLVLSPGDHRLQLGNTHLSLSAQPRSQERGEHTMAAKTPLHVIGAHGTDVVDDAYIIGTETMPELHGLGVEKRHAQITFGDKSGLWTLQALDGPVKIGTDGKELPPQGKYVIQPDEALNIGVGGARFSIPPRDQQLERSPSQYQDFIDAAARLGLPYDGERVVTGSLSELVDGQPDREFIALHAGDAVVDLYDVKEQARVSIARERFAEVPPLERAITLSPAADDKIGYRDVGAKRIVESAVQQVETQRAVPAITFSLSGHSATLTRDQDVLGKRGFAGQLFQGHDIADNQAALHYNHDDNLWEMTVLSERIPTRIDKATLRQYQTHKFAPGERATVTIGDVEMQMQIAQREQQQEQVAEKQQTHDVPPPNAIGGDHHTQERLREQHAAQRTLLSGLPGILQAYQAELQDRGISNERCQGILASVREVLEARTRVQLEFAALNDAFGIDRATMLPRLQRLAYADTFAGITLGLAEAAVGRRLPLVEQVVSPQRVGMTPANFTQALGRGMSAEAAGVAPRISAGLHMTSLTVSQQEAEYDPMLDKDGNPVIDSRTQLPKLQSEQVWRYRWGEKNDRAYVDERADGRYYVAAMREIENTKALDTALLLAAARYNGRITLQGEKKFIAAAVERAAQLGIVVTNAERGIQEQYHAAVKRVTAEQAQQLSQKVEISRDDPAAVEKHLESTLDGAAVGITRAQNETRGDRWYEIEDTRTLSGQDGNVMLMRTLDQDRRLTVGVLELPDELANEAPSRGDTVRLEGTTLDKIAIRELQRRKERSHEEQQRNNDRDDRSEQRQRVSRSNKRVREQQEG